MHLHKDKSCFGAELECKVARRLKMGVIPRIRAKPGLDDSATSVRNGQQPRARLQFLGEKNSSSTTTTDGADTV